MSVLGGGRARIFVCPMEWRKYSAYMVDLLATGVGAIEGLSAHDKKMSIYHTYLFKEATWQVIGQYSDKNGITIEVDGESIIIHESALWLNKSVMRLHTEKGMEFENVYRISPFKGSADTTSWTSMNNVLGRIKGQFVVVNDSIISLFQASDGIHKGTEYLLKMGDDRYLCRGALFKGIKRLSSWAVEIRRKS